MPAPVYESVATNTGTTNASSVTCNKPSGVVSGDLLLAVVSLRSASNTLTPPDGSWTPLESPFVDQSILIGVWWKIAGGSEPASYTWTFSDLTGTEFRSIAISRISGADATTPINAYGRNTNSTQQCPSITTTVNDCLLLALSTNNGGGSSRDFDPPSGYTEQWDIDSSGSGAEGQVGASKTGGTAGATGTASFTRTAGSVITTVNWHVAIAPSAAGGSSIVPIVQQLAS